MHLFSGSLELAQAANALELASRDHLKSLRDWNFDWLLGCTFAVGVGLLLELPEIVHDMCEIYGRKSRELKYLLAPSIDRREYPKRDWVKKWSAFGWVLIVLGVMGEGWFEAQVSGYDSALSNITDAVVADANARAAQAELELAQIKTPRSLTHVPEVIATLKPFEGTEYTFSSVCQEQECLVFLNQLDSVLQEAEWKRSKAPGGFPAINVFGSKLDFAVPVSLADGIAVKTESRKSLASLQALPRDKLPPYIRAAVALNLALFSNLDPPQSGDHVVDTEPGDSTVVQIAIGKKKP